MTPKEKNVCHLQFKSVSHTSPLTFSYHTSALFSATFHWSVSFTVCQGHSHLLCTTARNRLMKPRAWTYCGAATNTSYNLSCQSAGSAMSNGRIWWLKYWMFAAVMCRFYFTKLIAKCLVFETHQQCWRAYYSFGLDALHSQTMVT